MLVLFLVLFILLMMNWNLVPFSCVHYGHLLNLSPLPSVFELPSRCCSFPWCNSWRIKTSPFFGVCNGLIFSVGSLPGASPFPNILELPMMLLLSLLQLLINQNPPLLSIVCNGLLRHVSSLLCVLELPLVLTFLLCGSWWIEPPSLVFVMVLFLALILS